MNRAFLRAVVLAAVVASGSAGADEVAVPASMQAALLVKVAAYDRNLPARAGGNLRTLILVKAKSDESVRNAEEIKEALGNAGPIAGLEHVEELITFTSGAALAEACKAKKAAIVYVTAGLTDADHASIGQALEGVDVLSVAAAPGAVRKGIVLGFDLVSGKPKLLVDLPRAVRQNVALSANVLRLMTVYQ